MRKNQYSQEFKDQALLKTRSRGQRTLADMAIELNLALGTLKGWIKESNKVTQHLSRPLPPTPTDVPAKQFSAAQRLQALNESHTLTGETLAAWCREKGLFEHQLQRWRHDFCSVDTKAGGADKARNPEQIALRELRQANEKLQHNLNRKDKALAETAALLVLQKKFQALWADEAK
jgi:Transposase